MQVKTALLSKQGGHTGPSAFAGTDVGRFQGTELSHQGGAPAGGCPQVAASFHQEPVSSFLWFLVSIPSLLLRQDFCRATRGRGVTPDEAAGHLPLAPAAAPVHALFLVSLSVSLQLGANCPPLPWSAAQPRRRGGCPPPHVCTASATRWRRPHVCTVHTGVSSSQCRAQCKLVAFGSTRVWGGGAVLGLQSGFAAAQTLVRSSASWRRTALGCQMVARSRQAAARRVQLDHRRLKPATQPLATD